MAAALLLNETFVGRGFARALALFPYMLPTIVVVILMRWIFNDRYGVLKDPFGHSWSVATHVRDVTGDEMKAAMKAMTPG